MTTFAALIIVAVFGYLVYRYLPKGTERAFRLERFHPGTPMSDQPLSHYDQQRLFSDLAAIYGRNDRPDPGLPAPARPARDEPVTAPELSEAAEQLRQTTDIRRSHSTRDAAERPQRIAAAHEQASGTTDSTGRTAGPSGIDKKAS